MNRNQQLPDPWQPWNCMRACPVEQGDDGTDRKQRPGAPRGQEGPGEQRGSQA